MLTHPTFAKAALAAATITLSIALVDSPSLAAPNSNNRSVGSPVNGVFPPAANTGSTNANSSMNAGSTAQNPGTTSGAMGNTGQSASGANANSTNSTNSTNNQPRIIFIPGVGYVGWWPGYPYPYGYNPYAPSAGYYGSPSDVQNLSPATRGSTAAPSPRAEAELARSQMYTARMRLELEFQASDAYVSAKREVRNAQAAYDAALAQADRRLKNSPDYQRAETERQQAALQVDAMQATYRQPPEAPAPPVSPLVVRAAQQKLDAVTQERQIESEVLQKDPAVTAARARLEAAADRLNALNAQFDASVLNDPEWRDAKRRLESARAGIVQ